MANIIKRVWNQNRMVQIEDLKGMTFQAEQAGHTFQISGIDDDGNTVVLTGTPSGVLLRPDNTDVALTCSVSGGVVSATLPANCYDVPGRFGLTIFITSGSSKTAIYAAVGTVTRTSSGTVAPGTSQSVVDLINAINAAVNSIPASYSALLADIAPTYSNSALYSVGQYVWYDGDLKRCIVPITTAESYTAAHWTSAVLGQDVSDLKSAINADTEKIKDITGLSGINISSFLYARNAYIDASGNISPLNVVSLYRVPIAAPGFVQIEYPSADPFSGLGDQYKIIWEATDGTRDRSNPDSYRRIMSSDYYAFVLAKENTKYIYFCCNTSTEDKITIYINNPLFENKGVPSTILPINENTAIYSKVYSDNTNLANLGSGSNKVYWLKVFSGDKIHNIESIQGLSQLGGFISATRVVTKINSAGTFTAPGDGLVFFFYDSSETYNFLFEKNESVKLKTSDIIDIDKYDPPLARISIDKSLPDSAKRGMDSLDLHNELFYKKDIYINTSEIALPGYSVYKIPINNHSVLFLGWNPADIFIPSGFSMGYAFRGVTSNNEYTVLSTGYQADETSGCAIVDGYAANIEYVTICVYTGWEHKIWYTLLDPLSSSEKINGVQYKNGFIYSPDETNGIRNSIYTSNIGVSSFGGQNLSTWFTVNAGDVLSFKTSITGFNFLGAYIDEDHPTGAGTQLSLQGVTFTKPAVVVVFRDDGHPNNAVVKPSKATKISYSNVTDIPPIVNTNPYDGMNGVAFGTSLTANARPGGTGGYLNYLPELSGITFDNQGSGGATILYNEATGCFYPIITGYTHYIEKEVCILEGFVNDWYYNAESLGTWKDTGTATVCGCVRSAINHIFTQNPNITLFIVLDHYGKAENATTVENSEGATQYEFYSEIEKVAVSMGVRVIREFELSEISERTPQYLRDNIHLTDVGCQQSANAIWFAMKQTYPNVSNVN